MNIKKFTQKDRYGNMMSFEFEVPPMQDIPHPGGPVGTDTVPAWLTPGERVMNAEAERMFGPQLYAMNEAGRAVQRAQGGTIPEYSACGGKVKYAAEGDFVSFEDLPGFNLIKEQEGFNPEVYADDAVVKGAKSVGYGHRLLPGEKTSGYTQQELDDLYMRDFLMAQQNARENIPNFDAMPPELQGAFTSQAYQLGDKGQEGFENMIAALNEGDRAKAMAEVQNSDWAKQTPQRSNYLYNAIAMNELEAPPPRPPESDYSLDAGMETYAEDPERRNYEGRDKILGRSGEIVGNESFDVAGSQGQEAPSDITEAERKLIEFRKNNPSSRKSDEEVLADIDKADKAQQEADRAKAEEIDNEFKNEPNPYTDGMDDEEAEAIASTVQTKGKEIADSDPTAVDKIIDVFKGAFGSMYDEQELGRMAIMYLGSRAFGYSHGGSARFAVKNYIKRTDAKAAAKTAEIKDLVKSGDYTAASIEAYKASGNINDLKKATDLSDLKTEILVKATPGGGAPKIVEVTRGTDGQLRELTTGAVIDPTGFTRYAGELHDTGEIQTNAVNYIKESDRSLFQKEIREDGKVVDKKTIINPAGLVSAYSSRLRTLYGPRADIYLNDPEGRARLLAYAEAARNHYERTGQEVRNYEGLMAAVDSPLYTIEAGMTAKDGSTVSLDSYQILDENVNQYVAAYNSANPNQPITTGRAMLSSLNLFNKDAEDYSESEKDWLVKLKQKAADETPSGMSEEMYFTALYFKYLNEQ